MKLKFAAVIFIIFSSCLIFPISFHTKQEFEELAKRMKKSEQVLNSYKEFNQIINKENQALTNGQSFYNKGRKYTYCSSSSKGAIVKASGKIITIDWNRLELKNIAIISHQHFTNEYALLKVKVKEIKTNWNETEKEYHRILIKMHKEAVKEAEEEAEEIKKEEEQKRRDALAYPLTVKKWSWYIGEYGNYITTDGLIYNNSSISFKFLKVKVCFFDSDGNFITSDFDYIEPINLRSGQNGTFKINTRRRAGISKANISFECHGEIIGAKQK